MSHATKWDKGCLPSSAKCRWRMVNVVPNVAQVDPRFIPFQYRSRVLIHDSKIFVLSLSSFFSILNAFFCFPKLEKSNRVDMGDSGITYPIASAAENSIQPIIYTPFQISQYLHHISLPLKLANSKPDLQLLAALKRHHLASIPFENLSLH